MAKRTPITRRNFETRAAERLALEQDEIILKKLGKDAVYNQGWGEGPVANGVYRLETKVYGERPKVLVSEAEWVDSQRMRVTHEWQDYEPPVAPKTLEEAENTLRLMTNAMQREKKRRDKW